VLESPQKQPHNSNFALVAAFSKISARKIATTLKIEDKKKRTLIVIIINREK